MAQADLKGIHYSQQLQSLLLRGAWADAAPAKAAKGQPMSWQELLRKFKKHCPTRHITAEVAVHTQSLSLLLLPGKTDVKNITPEDLDGDSEKPPQSLALGKECELDQSRVEEGRLGFAALELLNDTPEEHDSILYTRAYFAYALKRYKECLALLNTMSFDGNDPTPPGSIINTTHLQLPSDTSTGHQSSASSTSGTHLTWTGSIASVEIDVRDAKMWRMVEIVRSRCLQGMAREKLGQEEEALNAYEAAIPILNDLRIAHATSANTQSSVDPSFSKYRELWRWAERLLWRASCLSSRLGSMQRALAVCRAYATQSQYFPPSFRPKHRSVVTSLFLYGLLLTAPGYSTDATQTKLSWITEARTLLGEYRLVLATSTRFPKAGERNEKVEEFCDAVMAVWERSGARGNDAGWAIEMLWWASRMTFHSHRVFRHLVRLIHASGDNELAKRTFKLYIQLVSKARQASLGDIESTLHRKSLDEHENDEAATNGADKGETTSIIDTDRNFVDCLIFGARMLCRLRGDVEDARWAIECLETAKDAVSRNSSLEKDTLLRARLSCAQGIAESTLAFREADPLTRPVLMRRALDHLASAVQFNSDSSDAFYHLAIALLQAGPTRDLDACIRAARHAVELESGDIRYWHLLGLALSASGQHTQAREVLEIGEALEPDEDDETANDDPSSNQAAHPNTEQSPSRPAILEPSQKEAPSVGKLLLQIPEHPRSGKEDVFEQGLELRITLLSLIELVDGAEVASVKWVEVFAWFAERGGWAHPVQDRKSLKGNPSFDLPPMHTIPPSESDHETDLTEADSEVPQVTITRSASTTNLPSVGLPITIIPPSPNENGDSESIHTVRMSNEKDEEHGESRTKKAQRMIKEQVNKRQSQIQTFSKKLGKSNTLRSQMSRATSTPDFGTSNENSRLYQASSIHSRQRMSPRASYIGGALPITAPTPPPPPMSDQTQQRTAREKRLIANLWLTAAATLRRMGKLEQAKAAIQEAETLDKGNAGVWVQLGLYFVANNEIPKAISSFHKALVINPDHIPAVVHLAQQYLNPAIGQTAGIASGDKESRSGTVDLAAGMLSSFTKGPGWDVPEAWYLLAKAVSLQGRAERQRECLTYALGLVEGKPIRDLRVAIDCAL
ncbi:hypothetical protein CPB86DRAFT_835149 [Serendipita vermifera]|nr:hypothetical protein CPB86DRAFT_835149 [Serendipita vermifera]